jgi:hypothetical protein
VDVRAVLDSGRRKVALDGIEKYLVSIDSPFLVVTKHLNCAVDFRTEKEGLRLCQC